MLSKRTCNKFMIIKIFFHGRRYHGTRKLATVASTHLSSSSVDYNTLMTPYLEAIKGHSELNAFTFISSESHLKEQFNYALTLQSASSIKCLPIAVKDNFCVKQMPATCGSKMLSDFNPNYDATVVSKIRDAGGVIIGKTNMDEFGMGNGTVDSIYGPTKNVWGIDELDGTDWYVPGGSSGGSATSVASGMCFAAIGSDTGGSIRNPASYCGVIGFKPTYGSVSRYGLIPLVNSMDVPGVLSSHVKGCATLFDIIKGWDSKDSTTVRINMNSTIPDEHYSVKGLRVGIPKEFGVGVSTEVSSAWNYASDILRESGANVKQVSLPHTKYSISCYSVLNPCEVASNMARYDGLRYGHRSSSGNDSTESLYSKSRREGFNSVVRGRILAGNYFLLKENYHKYFNKALQVRRLIVEDFKNVFRDVDVLLTPCTLSTAPKYSEFVTWDNRMQSSVQDYCTQSANMAGVPAISLPIRLSEKNGMPISLQLISDRHTEKLLFNVSSFIEKFVKFPYKEVTKN